MFYHLDSLLHSQRWRERRREPVRRQALLSAFASIPCLSPTRMVPNVLHCGDICFLHTLPRAALEVCKIDALGVGVERDVSEVILEGTKCFLIHTAPWATEATALPTPCRTGAASAGRGPLGTLTGMLPLSPRNWVARGCLCRLASAPHERLRVWRQMSDQSPCGRAS